MKQDTDLVLDCNQGASAVSAVSAANSGYLGHCLINNKDLTSPINQSSYQSDLPIIRIPIERICEEQSECVNLNANSPSHPQIQRKKTPRRLMKAINLLVNVKSFYNILTRNTRIFTKITERQYSMINDKASHYSIDLIHAKRNQSKNRKKDNFAIKLFKTLMRQILRFVCFFEIPVFQPQSKLKILWDFFQAISIISSIFIFSLIIVFGFNPHEIIMYLKASLLLFLMDFLVQFNTGIVLKGVVVDSRRAIAIKYFRGSLIMDIGGILPLLMVTTNLLNSINQELSEDSLLTSIIQSFILMKCSVLKEIFDRLEQRFGYQKNLENIIDLIKLLFTIGTICHFFSLVWYAIGLNEPQGSKSWITFLGIENQDIYTKYIYSFYYIATTMITVGYGDITPQNDREVVFAILTMFLTGAVYAYSLNCIGNILENINEVNKDFRSQMRTIHHMMHEQGIKQNLQVKISNYVEYLCKESNNQVKEKRDAIVNKLSQQLKNELMEEIKGKVLSDIPLFSEILTSSTKSQIISEMEECLYSPGEVIFQMNDQDDYSIFYILKGQVEISVSGAIMQLLEKRGCFGELSFVTGNQRNSCAIATDFCRIYKIKRESFLRILKTNSHDWENFQMMKETVSFKNNLKFAKIYCYSCKKGDHLVQNCPKTHLVLSKSIILQKHNNSVDQTRLAFQRLPRQTGKSLLLMNQIQESLIRIHQEEEFADILQELERTVKLNDSYLDLHFSDEEELLGVEVNHQKPINKKPSFLINFVGNNEHGNFLPIHNSSNILTPNSIKKNRKCSSSSPSSSSFNSHSNSSLSPREKNNSCAKQNSELCNIDEVSSKQNSNDDQVISRMSGRFPDFLKAEDIEVNSLESERHQIQHLATRIKEYSNDVRHIYEVDSLLSPLSGGIGKQQDIDTRCNNAFQPVHRIRKSFSFDGNYFAELQKFVQPQINEHEIKQVLPKKANKKAFILSTQSQTTSMLHEQKLNRKVGQIQRHQKSTQTLNISTENKTIKHQNNSKSLPTQTVITRQRTFTSNSNSRQKSLSSSNQTGFNQQMDSYDPIASNKQLKRFSTRASIKLGPIATSQKEFQGLIKKYPELIQQISNKVIKQTNQNEEITESNKFEIDSQINKHSEKLISDLFLEFETIRSFKYYYPQFNIDRVISNYSEAQIKMIQFFKGAQHSMNKSMNKGRQKRNNKIPKTPANNQFNQEVSWYTSR